MLNGQSGNSSTTTSTTTTAAALLQAAGGQQGQVAFSSNPLQSQLAAANAALLRGALPTPVRVSLDDQYALLMYHSTATRIVDAQSS